MNKQEIIISLLVALLFSSCLFTVCLLNSNSATSKSIVDKIENSEKAILAVNDCRFTGEYFTVYLGANTNTQLSGMPIFLPTNPYNCGAFDFFLVAVEKYQPTVIYCDSAIGRNAGAYILFFNTTGTIYYVLLTD